MSLVRSHRFRYKYYNTDYLTLFLNLFWQSSPTVRLSTVLCERLLRSRSFATSLTMLRKKSLSPSVLRSSRLVARLWAGPLWGSRTLLSIRSESMLMELGGREVYLHHRVWRSELFNLKNCCWEKSLSRYFQGEPE